MGPNAQLCQCQEDIGPALPQQAKVLQLTVGTGA